MLSSSCGPSFEARKSAHLRMTPREEVASHPPGCNCAVHLAWRKKAARAG